MAMLKSAPAGIVRSSRGSFPGASRLSHVESNIQASDLKPLAKDQMVQIQEIYEKYIKESVHHLW